MQIKYSSYLRHASEPYTSEAGRKILGSGTVNSGGSSGNPYHDKKTGQFTFSPNKVGSALTITSKGINTAHQNISRIKTKGNERIDLSNMSDQELQKILNRERMEQEYNRYFNTPQESKGKNFIDTVLPAAATIVGMAGTAIAAYAVLKPDKK